MMMMMIDNVHNNRSFRTKLHIWNDAHLKNKPEG